MPNRGLRGGTGPGLAVAVARRYWIAGGPNWAAAVGLRLLLALLPIAVLAGLVIQAVLPPPPPATTPARLGVRGGTRILRGDETLTGLLSGLIGNLHQPGHTLGILSLLGLLWIGSGLFACLESATAAIYGSRGRSYLRQRSLQLSYPRARRFRRASHVTSVGAR